MDESYAQIGSANLDPRSLRLNFEIAMEVYDSPTCRWLSRYIIEARDRSKVLSAEMLSNLSVGARLRDSVCWLMSPYL